tara:strand:+ start:355 stop:1437 length:1083 start_codon:yes stop_codon:yes gene_type:complete
MNNIYKFFLCLTCVSLLKSDAIQNSRNNAITRAIKKVGPAVASINVEQNKKSVPFDPFDPFSGFTIRPREIYPSLTSGSGVIISPDGFLLTNYHVIENAYKITVTLPGGDVYQADIIGSDKMSDLSLLKLEGSDFLYAELGDSDDLIIGEWVIALGNPLKLFQFNNQPSASIGIVSATNMDFGMQQSGKVFQDMIQTDAAINTGNSGGPLVNSLGEVVGINTFIFRDSEFNRSSTGIGFAIPINYAKRVAKELKLTGEIDRNYYIGFLGSPLDRRLANYLDIPFVKGVIINQVFKSSPAEKAGLRLSDIILSCNGVEVKEANDIFKIIHENDIRAGEIVRLKIFRKGRYKNIKMKIERFK